MGHKVISVHISGNQSRDVIVQLSACTSKVTLLHISQSSNGTACLTADILLSLKLNMEGGAVTTPLVSLIVQSCSELTSIELHSHNIYDSAVITITHHCPKLETLLLRTSIINITYLSLLALSERSLPLEELIHACPHIQTLSFPYATEISELGPF